MNTQNNANTNSTSQAVLSSEALGLVLMNSNAAIIQQLTNCIYTQNGEIIQLETRAADHKEIIEDLKKIINDDRQAIVKQDKAIKELNGLITAHKFTLEEQEKTINQCKLQIGVRESMFDAQHKQSEELIALLDSLKKDNECLTARIIEQNATIEKLKKTKLEEINSMNRFFNFNQNAQIEQSSSVENTTSGSVSCPPFTYFNNQGGIK